MITLRDLAEMLQERSEPVPEVRIESAPQYFSREHEPMNRSNLLTHPTCAECSLFMVWPQFLILVERCPHTCQLSDSERCPVRMEEARRPRVTVPRADWTEELYEVNH